MLSLQVTRLFCSQLHSEEVSSTHVTPSPQKNFICAVHEQAPDESGHVIKSGHC